MLSETGLSVVAAVQEFCKNCDHLESSMQFPKPDGEVYGRACQVLGMQGMIERHQENSCRLAIVHGVLGVMTTERFIPGGETTT